MTTQLSWPERFWQFSLCVYKQPDIKAKLLAFHTDYGVNLNIMLFCCWFARSGQGHLYRDDLIRANELIFSWHDNITMRLRQLRKTVARYTSNRPFHGVSEMILKEEILAEKEEQLALASYIFSSQSHHLSQTEKRGIALDNINTYLDVLTVPKTETRLEKIHSLCEMIFLSISNEKVV